MEARGDEMTILNLTHRILTLDFSAIHTSSTVRLFMFPNSLTKSNKNIV